MSFVDRVSSRIVASTAPVMIKGNLIESRRDDDIGLALDGGEILLLTNMVSLISTSFSTSFSCRMIILW